MTNKVIILAGQSLIANGVTNRFHQLKTHFDFDVVDLDESDALEKLIQAEPSVIVMDIDDPKVSAELPIQTLMDMFPTLKIVCLSPESSQTRVIQWAFQPINQITDLINVL